MMRTEDFYLQVRRSIPIACCDLLVIDSMARVLLLRRRNHPAQDQWWFPGGRILYLEERSDACLRILRSECGIHVSQAQELGTFDVLLENPATSEVHQGITTLYGVRVEAGIPVCLDEQSIDHGWRTSQQWSCEHLHTFVSGAMTLHDRIA